MSAGIDSLAATELTTLLTDRLGTELEPTVLFDHPTIDSLAKFVAATDTASVRRSLPQPGKVMEPRRASLDVYISQKLHIQLPGPSRTLFGLQELVIRGQATNQRAPISRWDVEADIRAVKASATYGAFLAPDTFSFDASAFGISRIEARVLDPMELLVLEASDAVSRVSSPTSHASPTNLPMGCFLGASGMFKDVRSSSRVEKAHTAYSASSGQLSVLSGRISYTFGWIGPCLTTDTACSSSLVAMHLAASAIKLGECPQAIAAGAQMTAVSWSTVQSAAGMLSPLGRCHSFDRRADGYSRGEGCGAFHFSSSSDGVAVSGTAVQQDGPSASLTAPNGSSQQRLIEAVQSDGTPSLEAHGTGTALGDPIEVRPGA